MKIHSATIMLTDFCNLQCPHCYKKSINSVCNLDRVKSFIKENDIRLIKIFGGEPLLPCYFDTLKELTDFCDINKICYFAQSNLTFELSEDLLNIIKKFCKFGTSFNFRRWKNKKQYDLWIENSKKVLEIKDTYCLCTLDVDMISKEPEYVFNLLKNDLPFKNYCFDMYVGDNKPNNKDVDEWLCKYYLLERETDNLNIMFKMIIGSFTNRPITYRFTNKCFNNSYIFHTDGHITFCPMIDIDISTGKDKLEEMFKLDETCKNCKWLGVCHGVCPLLKHDKNYCKGYPKLFEIIKQDIDNGYINI